MSTELEDGTALYNQRLIALREHERLLDGAWRHLNRVRNKETPPPNGLWQPYRNMILVRVKERYLSSHIVGGSGEKIYFDPLWHPEENTTREARVIALPRFMDWRGHAPMVEVPYSMLALPHIGDTVLLPWTGLSDRSKVAEDADGEYHMVPAELPIAAYPREGREPVMLGRHVMLHPWLGEEAVWEDDPRHPGSLIPVRKSKGGIILTAQYKPGYGVVRHAPAGSDFHPGDVVLLEKRMLDKVGRPHGTRWGGDLIWTVREQHITCTVYPDATD